MADRMVRAHQRLDDGTADGNIENILRPQPLDPFDLGREGRLDLSRRQHADGLRADPDGKTPRQLSHSASRPEGTVTSKPSPIAIIAPSLSLSSASRMFIGGDPLKVATNRLTGWR